VKQRRSDVERAGPGTVRSKAGVRAPVASVLALQRAMGNNATGKLLRKETAEEQFQVVIVKAEETGLSQDAIDRGIATVKKELATVTSTSKDKTVKRGFKVHYRQSDGDLTGLHRRLLLVYLMEGRDSDRAIELARPHMPKGWEGELRQQAHELNSIGGANLRVEFDSGKAPSVSLVSTGALAKFTSGREGGDKLAGLLLGEIILHELGHALLAKHDEGIMQGKVVFDAATLGKPRHFSADSKQEMRDRLEFLAGR
jgi:hypothetical protein